MKSFTEFLTESEKTYFFKIGIAGELPEGCDDMLETCLKRYGIKNMTSGKRTPIQERPRDFPNLQNMEVTYFEVELSYPTTDHILKEYVGACCGIHQSHVFVVNPHAQEVADGDQTGQARTESDQPYQALLDTPELQDPISSKDAQQNVGGNKVMDLLQELEKARKERKNDPIEGAPKGESKDIDSVENATSPIGSK